ncbi:glycosyltransferase involved in cell wall biosynthesis [Nocardioides sp. BE266]|uniref:glycosyltransferase family 2 protein n=1 Tax=Nocardioides sp. BE266 TaxID=2817725 RepID=UPI002862F5C6|nr:glycosyltransferase family A protein [Nocardioides sp. BE266]MDR7252140.1 glycosyltransferase involved in cell wall biosynthesis [Nocardioides sp. BE266]
MDIVLSVVIPMHNGESTIRQALSSFGAQHAPPPFEVVVVDNRSTDGSAEEVRDFAATSPFPVRLVEAHERAGAAYARNTGAQNAASQRLVFCDCDDTYDPWFLNAMNEALDHADIVAASHERPDEYAAGLASSPVDQRGAPHAPQFNLLGYLPTGGGGGLGVQRQHWQAVGGFDNSYRRGAEDNDFYWRVQEAGGVMLAAPRAIVIYRHRETLDGTFRQYLSYRRGATLLQARFDVGDRVTLAGSLRHLAQTVLSAPRLVRTEAGRRSLAAQLGGITGSILGLVRHQLLRRIPPRELMTS